jgi:hypothetical protein
MARNPAFTPQREARLGDMPGYSHSRLSALLREKGQLYCFVIDSY